MSASEAPDQRRRWRPAVALAYAAAIGLFLSALAQYYIPGKGFTYLIAFGGQQTGPRVAGIDGLDYYVSRDSPGYDAQFYAQIATDPLLRDPQLKAAVDNVPYRARRMLFSWTAFVLGFGRPAWILQAYALQNALCWLLLAAVLLRWFPPESWGDFLRWGGVLFSSGLCASVRNSLVDGPSLLLVALGVWGVERNRTWLAAAVLALGGLGKETNLLGAAALPAPGLRGGRAWLAFALRIALVAAPLALWLIYVQVRVGSATGLGDRNFDWPLLAYGRKWIATLGGLLPAETPPGSRTLHLGAFVSLGLRLLMLVALTVQVLFLALRPRLQDAWWRVGASFAVLMLVLGDAVWEGYPGAASRVLLPMQLAFNVLVPRGRGWAVVLVLGNLTLLNAPAALEAPPDDRDQIDGPAALLQAPDGDTLRVTFNAAWYPVEGSRTDTWHWSRGDAAFSVFNPQPFPVEARVTMALRATGSRRVRLAATDRGELWQGPITEVTQPLEPLPLRLEPGENRIELTSDAPAARPTNGDSRLLAICVRRLRIEITGRALAAPR